MLASEPKDAYEHNRMVATMLNKEYDQHILELELAVNELARHYDPTRQELLKDISDELHHMKRKSEDKVLLESVPLSDTYHQVWQDIIHERNIKRGVYP